MTETPTPAPDILETLAAITDKPVAVPGVPNVFVRVMSGDEGDAWDDFTSKAEKNSQVHAKIAVMCGCDKDGKPLFKAGQEAELARRLSRKILHRIWEAAWNLNKLDSNAEKKDSAPAPISDSGSSSVGPSI